MILSIRQQGLTQVSTEVYPCGAMRTWIATNSPRKYGGIPDVGAMLLHEADVRPVSTGVFLERGFGESYQES